MSYWKEEVERGGLRNRKEKEEPRERRIDK